MGWRLATPEEARACTAKLKNLYKARHWGEMNADNLWLHLVAGFEDGQERVDGFLYFLRDSLYTVLAECWFDSPQASLCLPDGIRQFQALCGGSRTVAGFIDVGRNRWVNTLLAHGARYVKMAINVEWEV